MLKVQKIALPSLATVLIRPFAALNPQKPRRCSRHISFLRSSRQEPLLHEDVHIGFSGPPGANLISLGEGGDFVEAEWPGDLPHSEPELIEPRPPGPAPGL